MTSLFPFIIIATLLWIYRYVMTCWFCSVLKKIHACGRQHFSKSVRHNFRVSAVRYIHIKSFQYFHDSLLEQRLTSVLPSIFTSIKNSSTTYLVPYLRTYLFLCWCFSVKKQIIVSANKHQKRPFYMLFSCGGSQWRRFGFAWLSLLIYRILQWGLTLWSE